MSPDQQRDWDKELAEIDKIIAKAPPAKPAPVATGGGAPAPAAAGRSLPPAAIGRRQRLTAWLRVGLGVALAAGMTQWPYFHACGTALFMYLAATGVVVVAGLWGAVTSWRRRLGLAHAVSLLVALWGGVLAAATILPRVGYAKGVATWWCP